MKIEKRNVTASSKTSWNLSEYQKGELGHRSQNCPALFKVRFYAKLVKEVIKYLGVWRAGREVMGGKENRLTSRSLLNFTLKAIVEKKEKKCHIISRDLLEPSRKSGN